MRSHPAHLNSPLPALLKLEPRRLFSALSTIAIFHSSEGATPYSSVTVDGVGNLFGDTRYGGANGVGAIYSLSPGSSAINTIASLNLATGEFPQGDVLLDPSGNLYAAASAGGANFDGAIVTVPSGERNATALATFNAVNGQTPSGQLVELNGNIYGTAENGGAFGDGVVYRVSNTGGAITVVASFNVNNGQSPRGGLIADSSGNLFGVTFSGGANGDGTVFEIPQGASAILTLASFNVTNGQNPLGRLTLDSAGNLFGTTSAGGATGNGEVFEIHASSNVIVPLASFNVANGQYPQGDIAIDSSGDLFGTAQSGGVDGQGTVWELPAGEVTLSTLYSFNGQNDGGTPIGGVVLDGSGNLFGATSAAAAGFGTVFEIAGIGFTSDSNGVLSIHGTTGNDTISLSGQGSTWTVTLNGQTSPTYTSVSSLIVTAGAGADSVNFSNFTGNATVHGAGGNDSLIGGAANDSLIGGGGNDLLRGAAGNDSLIGAAGNDTLKGNAGDDTLDAGPGNDSLNGNVGNDSVVAGAGPDSLAGGPGIDSVKGSIVAGYSADLITTGDGSDSLQVSTRDVLLGDASQDTVDTVN